MKVRIQGEYDTQTKQFSKTKFQVKNFEHAIRGRFVINRKHNEEWVSGSMTFVVFKNKVEQSTIDTILNHNNGFLNIEGNLMPEKGKDGKAYWCFVINSASPAEQTNTKPQQNVAEEYFDTIPF